MFYYLAVLFNIIIVPLVFKVLKAIGIGAVSYVGINIILDQVTDYIMSRLGGSSAIVQQILGVASFDVIVNIYLSAIVTRAVLSGMNKASGRKKDFVLKA